MYGKGRAQKNNTVIKTSNNSRHSNNAFTKMHTKHLPWSLWSQTCMSAWTHTHFFNPLNAEWNPICWLLALLGAHHFLHVSRIRVKEAQLSVQLTQETRPSKHLQYTFRAASKGKKLTPLLHQFLKWTNQNGKGHNYVKVSVSIILCLFI